MTEDAYLFMMCVNDSGAEWERPLRWNSSLTALLLRKNGFRKDFCFSILLTKICEQR